MKSFFAGIFSITSTHVKVCILNLSLLQWLASYFLIQKANNPIIHHRSCKQINRKGCQCAHGVQ